MGSSLDEKTPHAQQRTTRQADAAGQVHYILRNGITIAVPAISEICDSPGADEMPRLETRQPAEPNAAIAAAIDTPPAADDVLDTDGAELWQRLPRHIQLLVSIVDKQEEEAAQKYYTRGFKESRSQLIERLLDPTLTLEDTARVLGVVPATVRRYTNRGLLPHHRTVGQQRRFRLSDVLAFLDVQRNLKKHFPNEDPEFVENGRTTAQTGE